jgi:hypothetical protein
MKRRVSRAITRRDSTVEGATELFPVTCNLVAPFVPLFHQPVSFVDSTGAQQARPERVLVRERRAEMHPAISREMVRERIEMEKRVEGAAAWWYYGC